MQLGGSLPSSAKAVDHEVSERERDVLAKLPLEQLLQEVRMRPPEEPDSSPLHLLDASRRCMSPRELTKCSVLAAWEKTTT